MNWRSYDISKSTKKSWNTGGIWSVYKANKYRVEYYFKTKNEEKEETIEKLLLDGGFLYEKSEDVYIESEDLYVIYYEV